MEDNDTVTQMVTELHRMWPLTLSVAVCSLLLPSPFSCWALISCSKWVNVCEGVQRDENRPVSVLMCNSCVGTYTACVLVIRGQQRRGSSPLLLLYSGHHLFQVVYTCDWNVTRSEDDEFRTTCGLHAAGDALSPTLVVIYWTAQGQITALTTEPWLCIVTAPKLQPNWF